MDKLCSIIIRTKNEEQWISKCLEAVFGQSYKNIEVIIVDNCSTDTTIKRAEEFPVKILNIKKFVPGRAINLGINSSNGEYICCLSAHCIPTNNLWLENLLRPLSDKSIAGTYGRQEPTPNSSDIDKRDLLLVFGLDSYIQYKDSFFHNANSAFRKEVWEKYPFCDNATNIEDRIWGEEVIKNGYKIAYIAESSVFHWHGIHHELNPERAKNIVKILDKIPRLNSYNNEKFNILRKNHCCYCVIPIKSVDINLKNIKLIRTTINCLKKSKLIKKIVISTDYEKDFSIVEDPKIEIIKRPHNLSDRESSLEDVLKYTLEKIESTGEFCDSISVAEIIYPFRDIEVVDEMIKIIFDESIDTVFASWKESRATWFGENDELRMLGGSSWTIPSQKRFGQTITSLIGYFTVTKPKNVRNKTVFEGNIKAHLLKNRNNTIVCRNNIEYNDLCNQLNQKLI